MKFEEKYNINRVGSIRIPFYRPGPMAFQAAQSALSLARYAIKLSAYISIGDGVLIYLHKAMQRLIEEGEKGPERERLYARLVITSAYINNMLCAEGDIDVSFPMQSRAVTVLEQALRAGYESGRIPFLRKACIGNRLVAELDADLESGQRHGVSGTPAFFINGRLLSGAQPFANFQQIIDEELESAGGL